MVSDVLPIVPEFITVHLGAPSASAENVTVSFPDYIKNVASSELYPTWPESALRANILAQISFALNRVYTESYRAAGYDFDITNSTAYDQAFVKGRDIFENISQIVDEIFNDYVVRQGNVEPLFTSYCNGTTVTCGGLSQWGSVSLANSGFIPYRILQNYYGDNINIVRDAPVGSIEESAPETPLRLGSTGNDVRLLQLRLNRISKNYPGIPKISPVTGIFTPNTEEAVKKFQQIFNLTQDGIVGNATWYKVAYIFNAVKRLNDLTSEGLKLEEVSKQFPEDLRLGDEGINVRVIQYFLAVIADYYDAVPPIAINGVFDENTRDAVYAFQRVFGLPIDGVVNRETWDSMHDAYLGILNSLPDNYISSVGIPFPGEYLAVGSQGEYVTAVQTYLDTVATVYPSITPPNISGTFTTETEDAVKEFQRLFDLDQSGVVGPLTWDELADQYVLISEGNLKSDGQFGQNLGG